MLAHHLRPRGHVPLGRQVQEGMAGISGEKLRTLSTPLFYEEMSTGKSEDLFPVDTATVMKTVILGCVF